jgi:hypothetical protein
MGNTPLGPLQIRERTVTDPFCGILCSLSRRDLVSASYAAYRGEILLRFYTKPMPCAEREPTPLEPDTPVQSQIYTWECVTSPDLIHTPKCQIAI